MGTVLKFRKTRKKIQVVFLRRPSRYRIPLHRGGSRIFFRRGCTRLLLYFNTNKPHSFFCRIPVVLENRRSSRGGGEGGAPPAPSPQIRPCFTFSNETTVQIKGEARV